MGAWCSESRLRSESETSAAPIQATQAIRLDDFITNELEPICPTVKVYVRMSTWSFEVRLRQQTISDRCIQKLVVVTVNPDGKHEVVAACLLVNEFPKGLSKHNISAVDIRWLDATGIITCIGPDRVGYSEDQSVNLDSELLKAYLVYAKLLGYERAYFCVNEPENHAGYIFRDCPLKRDPAQIRAFKYGLYWSNELADFLLCRYQKEVLQQQVDKWQFAMISAASADLPVLPNPSLMQV